MGLLALLSLIPLIILYIIKPKPKEIDVPSLMFFQKDQKRKKERAFFNKLRSDWLFIAQLLTLLLLSLFFLKPYLMLDRGLLLDRSVIVLDASASMGVDNVFEKAINEAKKVVGKSNTLILVSTTPYVALEDADKKSILKFLDELRVGAVPSPIGSAVSLAGQYATGNAHIFVISDFMDTGSMEFNGVKESLERDGVIVHVIDVGEKKDYDNIGIVGVKPGIETSEITVKNFKNKAEDVGVTINGKKRLINIAPGASEIVSFESKLGDNTIILDSKDDFSLDNSANIIIPTSHKINVFVLSDDPSKYLKAALTSADDIDLDIGGTLPIKDRDVYIIQNVKGLSQQEANELEKKVKNGASVVVYAQPDMKGIDYGALLPVELGEKKGFAKIEEQQPNKFTKEIEFGSLQQHFEVKKDYGVALLKADNSSVLSLQVIGNGKAAYYGILEGATDFTFNPGYPIFWVNFVRYLGNARTIADVNRQGGSVITLPEKTNVKTPSTTIYTNIFYLHEPGVYEIGDDKIAVNLMDEKESRLESYSEEDSAENSNAQASEGIRQDLDIILLYLALALLFIELIITKAKGEV